MSELVLNSVCKAFVLNHPPTHHQFQFKSKNCEVTSVGFHLYFEQGLPIETRFLGNYTILNKGIYTDRHCLSSALKLYRKPIVVVITKTFKKLSHYIRINHAVI